MATVAVSAGETGNYLAAEPFPHCIIDNFLERSRALAAARELQALRLSDLRPTYAQVRKRALTDRTLIPPATLALIDELNSTVFVAWLEQRTGIPGLRPDPSLFGGGVHQIARGGFLKIHADFAWHAGLRLYRRVNVLLYLNEDWREEWGGALELWPQDMSAAAISILPSLNRMVIFSTTDTSYHGHPEPLDCPEGVTRNSLALYYYTTEPAPASAFPRSEFTNHRPRPGERFWNPRFWRQQWLIRRRGRR